MLKCRCAFGAVILLCQLPLPSAFSDDRCEAVFTGDSSKFSIQSRRARAATFEAISALPDNGAVGPEIFRLGTTESIAEGIVARIRQKELQFQNEYRRDPKVDLQRDTDLILFFAPEHALKIREMGFLNQHETTDARGLYDPSLRKRIEDNFTGIQIGNERGAEKVRPKSAFLNIRTPIELAAKDSASIRTYGYGGIGAVLKNSKKMSAVWTFDDSANLGIALGKSEERTLVKYRGTFQRGSISVADTLAGSRTRRANRDIEFGQFYEGLIYGEVNAQDVDFFLVSHRHYADLLSVFGKPVFEAVQTFENQRTVFKKGDLLFDGGRVVDGTRSDQLLDLFPSLEGKSLSSSLKSWLSVNTFASLSRLAVGNKTYSILSPGSVPAWFNIFINEYTSQSRNLTELGIRVKTVVSRNSSFAVLEAGSNELMLNELTMKRREIALGSLAAIIEKLIDAKINWIVHPDLLVVSPMNEVIVIGYSRYSKFRSNPLEIIALYEESLEQGWDKYLSADQIQKIRTLLDRKKRDYESR